MIHALLRHASGRVSIRLPTGVRMIVDLEDRVQRLEAFMLYERRELELMRSSLVEGDVAFDLGAHVGYFALHAAQIVGERGRVHAFEPAPDNVERLRANTAVNGFENVEIVAAAVSATSGRAIFRLVDAPGETGWGSVMLDPDENTRDREVPTWSIDDYARERGIDHVRFMKLDVQGSELASLTGARKILERDRPLVLCEIAEAWWGSAQTTTTADIFSFMHGLEYEGWGILHAGGLRRVTAAGPDFLNVLFRPSAA